MKDVKEVGFVQSVRGQVAYIDGLPNVSMGEVVVGQQGERGYVGSFYKDHAEVFLLDGPAEPGEMFSRKGTGLGNSVGDFLLGRVINPLGEAIDHRGALNEKDGERVPMFQKSVGIMGRRFIESQFDTGITVIDTIFPLGKGQRELFLGEGRSGKTQTLIDIVANQVGKKVVCVFALIGRPVSEVRGIWANLERYGILSKIIFLVASSADPSPLIYLAPHAAMSVAEWFAKSGRDVLVILEDMGSHARNYREMTLLSGGSPGRESYPGDIFYQHARIVERAGSFVNQNGKQGGSITLLPVLELASSDISSFIPTNLMGMTDGHLLFKPVLSRQGRHPAIDLFFSVTRVGSQTQDRLQNKLATKIKEVLARGAELELVSRFGSELPLETRQLLTQKRQIEELLSQPPRTFLSKEIQIMLLGLTFTAFLKGKDLDFVKNNHQKLITALAGQKLPVCKDLDQLFAYLETLKLAL